MQYNLSNILIILYLEYFYNQLRFKVVVDKSYRDHFFRTQCIYVSRHQLDSLYDIDVFLISCFLYSFSCYFQRLFMQFNMLP